MKSLQIMHSECRQCCPYGGNSGNTQMVTVCDEEHHHHFLHVFDLEFIDEITKECASCISSSLSSSLLAVLQQRYAIHPRSHTHPRKRWKSAAHAKRNGPRIIQDNFSRYNIGDNDRCCTLTLPSDHHPASFSAALDDFWIAPAHLSTANMDVHP